MRAAVYHGNRDIRVESVPDPQAAPGEVKLRIDFSTICATDIEEYLHGPKFIPHDSPHPITGRTLPIVTGHELTGTVVDAGEGVEGFRTGDRAVIYATLCCGQCRWCLNNEEMHCPTVGFAGFSRDGGLAEQMTWPASRVVPLPDGVTSQQAALAEPASVAVHAVRRARVKPGDRVAVLGTGAVGMLVLQVAKSAGALVYAIDRRQASLDLAQQFGADATINSETSDAAEAVRNLTDGAGADVVFDVAGAETTPPLAVEMARSRGTVVIVAIFASRPALDFTRVVLKQLDILGSMSYTMDEVREAVALMAAGKVDTAPLVSDVIGLDQVVDVGYARMLQPAKDVFRILVDPSR